MFETITLVFPLIIFSLSGYFFKVIFSYSEDMGQILNKIILNITLPATIFLSFATSPQKIAQAGFLPVAGFSIQLSIFIVFFLLGKNLELDKKTECVFITNPLISNTLLFLAPFFYLAYGDVGITRLSLYDIGNAITIYFLAQTIFKSYEKKKFDFFSALKALLSSVPIWAFFLGMIVGELNLTVPEYILKSIAILREVNVFLPMFVLGFYFKPITSNLKLVLGTIFSKMFLGLLIGIGVSFMFHSPMDKITVIMGASAPVGVMSLIFASLYEKDTEFASSLVSYSMILGLIMISILNYFFGLFGLI